MAVGKCSGGGMILAILALINGAVACSGQTEPADPPSAATVAKLVAQLAVADFDARQRATDELVNLGAPILPALRKAATTNPELEVKRRIDSAVSRIENALLKAEEKQWQDLDRPRREIKDRLDKILAQTPALSDHQLRSATYLLTLGRPPTDAEIQRSRMQFTETNGRPLSSFQLARSLVQGKEFNEAVAVANGYLLSFQKALAKEMDAAKKQQLLRPDADGAWKIPGEVAASLNEGVKADEPLIDLAFLLALSRFPTATESTALAAHLKRDRNRATAIADIFWALMSSKEFLVAP